MNFSDLKRYFFLPYIISLLFIFASSPTAQAADIQAQLDSSNGSSGFTVESSSGVGVDRIDSNGNVGIGTTTSQTLLYVSPQGVAPEYAVGAGDAYIQNNLEVDGTTYLNDVYINGLEVNGLSLGPGPLSMGSLTVTGESYLATSAGNVGIGTVTPGSKLSVNGGVAIGTGLNYLNTLAPNNGLIVQGNVGIGTLAPGETLDVNGTVRATNLTMSGQSPIAGYVLTASDSSGDTTWTAAGTVSGWTSVGPNVFETGSGNVGIGTTFITSAALTVMNGNVGIGTWAPSAPLAIGNNAFTVSSNGRITATTGITTSGAYTQSGNGINAFTGNVGVGSLAPGQALDVNGTVRATNLTMSGQSPIAGYVLTASDSSGDTTWTAAGTVSGWTSVGPNVFETGSGNVGIGTTFITSAALTVMNGNVGIGTWAPSAPFAVGTNAFTVSSNGQITATTGITTSGAYTQSGNGINAFTGNVGVGSLSPGQALDVNGTARVINLTLSGQSPIAGYVLTASDSSGDTTWSSAGGVSGWTVSGNDVYQTYNGNVGIGTTLLTSAALTVMNGNVGIGTWVPSAPLAVGANAFTVSSNGQITATTGITTSGAYTQSGNNINAFTGNVGVGTTTPQSLLSVVGGNVGIGTWTAENNLSIVGGVGIGSAQYASTLAPVNGIIVSGNVGVGSLTPGQALDVNGTVRAINLTMSGQSPIAGYVLTASDSSGDATWSSAGGVSGWTVSGNNVYQTFNGNVGIGTSLLTTAALTVMNGNVGIGTWVPSAPLAVGANAFTVSSNGQITATTGITTSGAYTQSGNGINGFTGNVGIGSMVPGQALDVNGTIRTTNFTMTGQTPMAGYVLSASDSSGDATWLSPGGVSGWTVTGSNVYETGNGNVGIGTSLLTTAALTVMNGNVGIGTWVPSAPLAVGANAFTVSSNGQITATTGITTSGAYTQSGNGINAFTGNVGVGSLTPGQALDVNGTVRAINLTMSGQSPIAGYVLTASDSSGDATWSSPGGVSGWTVTGSNVYETGNGNVGIGTSLLTTAALTVMNGNVGIGTWVPSAPLAVGANAFTVSSNGQITATTGITTSGAYTQSGNGINGFTGNVGIGSMVPGQALDVNGTIRTTNFTMTGQTPMAGYVLSASDSSGDATWLSPGGVSGWTVTGSNVYETGNGNVGIGTSLLTTAALTVMNGNVGIGTWVPSAPLAVGANAFTVSSNGQITATTGITTSGAYTQSGNGINAFTGNVGVGSLTPGQALDVNGTVRAINLTMSGQSPIAGYVLTASDSSGDATWSSPGGVSGWTVTGSNVYETGNGNVGIGTSLLTTAALTVMNGNVGIGTWVPSAPLAVGANAFTVSSNGQITATTGITTSGAYTQSGNGINGFTGNVGIGSMAPGQALDVNGTIRTTNFTMTGQVPIAGYVLTASDSSGDATWSSPGGVSGWTISGNNVYETFNGNVGIGTTLLTTSALTVMNGNVGIGTWIPSAPLAIGNNAFTVSTNGQITATTGITTSGAYTQSGNGINSLTGNVGLGTTTPQSALSVVGGNVGIGTWTAQNNLSIVGGVGIGSATYASTLAPVNGIIVSGNVGIGSLAPGQKLDVTGTTRTTNFTMTGQVPIAGYVLTASDSSGDATWTSPGGVSGWTITGNNVYQTFNGNVGIGTTFLTTSALTVMNGNVGIGTWVPSAPLAIGNNAFTVSTNGQITATTGITTSGAYTQSGNSINTFSGNTGVGTTTPQSLLSVVGGNVGIGTWTAQNNLSIVGGVGIGSAQYASTLAPVNGIIVSGNVGIGSLAPGQKLDVTGTTRTTNFTMTGQVPIAGYVLTASDSSGDATWSSPGGVSGWTISGNNVYETFNGNVGIGTTFLTTSALTVMNGNVGIGTWIPTAPLAVGANAFTVSSNGQITATTGITTSGAYTQSGNNINSFTGNVGLGTTTPQSALSVVGGNVGIGTWTAQNNLSIVGGVGIGSATYASTLAPVNGIIVSGNVGIGSLAPGQKLDVTGTIRTTNFTMSGQSPIPGYILSASDSSGDATWLSIAAISGWTPVGNDVYETSGGNVGIGTTFITSAALTVMNGNVGIGTWVPSAPLAVGKNAFTVNSNGQITATTGITTSGAYTQSGNGINAFTGNVGIGSMAPGQALDVNGTIRTLNFTMSGQVPVAGYVLTASDSSGDATWTSPGGVSGWTISGNNVYETFNGNVGIGTSFLTTSALTVMNGNVGIGTWVPSAPLAVGKNAFTVSSNGQITATTGITTSGAYTQSGNGINVFTGNVGVGSLAPGQALDVTGTTRTTNFTMTGQVPIAGYVLTASDSSGDATWTSPGGVSGWTITGNNVYQTFNGNVGIGTTLLTTSALTVMNGNVGIGTWVPGGSLIVQGGNVGIGTNAPSALFNVNGNSILGTAGSSTDSIASSGTGSLAGGNALHVGSNSGIITASSTGSLAFGSATGNPAGNATIESIGSGTVALGLAVNGILEANGGGAIALGSAIGGNLEASAADSVAIGENVQATANNAFALGLSVVNPTASSFMVGFNPTPTLTVTGTNVGIGTWNPFGGGLIVTNGNVGIGSLAPGKTLDVTGTVRTTNFAMSGQLPIAGYVLTASDSSGDATWTSPGGVSGWTISGNNVYETDNGNVGIGTTFLTTSALTVMNGNVGIGTWVPSAPLAIGNNAFTVSSNGQITATTGITTSGAYTQSGNSINTFSGNTGVGTTTPQSLLSVVGGNVGIGTWTAQNRLSIVGGVGIGSATYASTLAPVNGIIVSGNVGIGSLAPGQALDVNGTVRMANLTMSGQAPIAGYVLTASDSSGDATWSSPGGVSGWTVTGNNVYETGNGNVGIGTTFLTTAALTVMNGNVGIGTWKTVNSLDVNNNEAIGAGYAGIKTAPPNGLIVQGNVGFGTFSPQTGLAVLGNVGIGTWTADNGKVIVMGGNVGIGTTIPPTMLSVGNGIPVKDMSMTPVSFFGGDVEVQGDLYATTIHGGQILTGDFDLGGYFLKSNQLLGNGTVLISGGTGADSTDLVVAPNHFVGIGTTTPGSRLTVDGGESIGTGLNYLTTLAPTNGLMVQGNVGIGSLAPGQALDVTGTIRTINFTMSGQAPIAGYVLTASDSSGDATWSSPGGVSGWTVTGNNVYETGNGNVGIGTTLLTTAALTVMNGNVGIGTWVPAAEFQVNNVSSTNAFVVTSTGNVGIGTVNPLWRLQINSSANASGVGLSIANPGNPSSYAQQIYYSTDTSYFSVGIGNSTESTFGVADKYFIYNSQTSTPSLVINGSGSVGIGSVNPIQALDVKGTVRTTNFMMTGQAPIAGYVLTASDSSGDATWSSPGGVSGWTVSGNNVYETGNGNVGIGTTFLTTAALTVMNGNVGIGTWVPSAPLAIGNNAFTVSTNGQITATTGITTSGAYTQSGNSINFFTGNVGIGSLTPGQKLDVTGTIRTTNLTMSGQAPIAGYVLTASDSSGDATWSSPGGVSGWTVTGNNVYETGNGNVGIGTTQLTTSALTVMNGNVGIGTWIPTAPLAVGANAFTVASNGQITATTGITTSGAYTQSGNSINFFTGNVGLGTSTPQASLSVVGGNVGIGTLAAQNNLSIVGGVGIGSATYASTLAPVNGIIVSGNVGIGSLAPGQKLDVTGTIRTTNFTMSGQAPIGGYVLTASDSSGDATWSSPGGIGGWTVTGNNVYQTYNGNVGIGTTFLTTAALTVMNGNVGIGTWAPTNALQISGPANQILFNDVGEATFGNSVIFNGSGQSTLTGSTFLANSGTSTLSFGSNGVANQMVINNGNVGIGTITPGNQFVVNGAVGIGTASSSYISTIAPAGGMIVQGNVGIGSLAPGQRLDVTGTIRTTNLTMSGQAPIAGYVLTASDSSGDATWSSPGGVSGWTVTGNNVYETGNGNVGIGTTFLTSAALTVMNGNVGIGTWTTVNSLDVNNNQAIGANYAGIKSAPVNGLLVQGNVGFGTFSPQTGLAVLGNVGIGTWTANNGKLIVEGGNVGIGTFNPPVLFAAGSGVPLHATAPDDSYFGHDVEVEGVLYATTVLGAQDLSGDFDLNGYFIKSTNALGNGNGTVLISGGLGADSADLVVAPNHFVGIGTTTPGSRLTVDGGESIGTALNYLTTLAPTNGLMVQGNVGIGSLAPGQALDVTGTIRTLNFTMSAQAPIAGYVLTASDSSGDATWSSPGGVSGWTVTGNNVYETGNGNVGIGTTFLTTAALTVMNGNVGIGTWVPANKFVVIGTTDIGADSRDTVRIFNNTVFGSIQSYINTSPSALVLNGSGGSVGIGSLAPGQALDVTGTIRTINFTMSGQAPIAGYVLTASDSSGDATWSSAGGVSGWTVTGNNVYQTFNGNVGIGTTLLTTSALTVMNGNVGIGTWIPNGSLIVQGGNVGIGTNAPSALFTVNGSSILGSVFSSTDSITSSGTGDLAGGSALHIGSNSGVISASGSGSLAYGFAIGGGLGNGSILAKNSGDIAMGASNTGETLQAAGNGSVALGEAVQALQNNDITLGQNVINNLSSTFMVGFNVTPTLTVTGTNVGIGTFNPFGGGLIVTNGNVGIGSLAPGKTLDVTGSVRTTNFTMSGQLPIAGYVMTASDSSGDATWSSPGGIGGWTVTGNNVYQAYGGNVGIGTTLLTTAALTVMNGNVGIGTWVVNGGALIVAPGAGNVGIGTFAPSSTLEVNGGVSYGDISGGVAAINVTSANGDLAGGYVFGNALLGSMTSSGNGSLAVGYVNAAGNVTSMTSSGSGSIAMGYVDSPLAHPSSALTSSGSGTIAMGANVSGTFIASNVGSIAMGYADSGNTLQATGQASVAIGQDVQALANNSFALGLNIVNPNASSFMVGFNASPTLTVTGTGVGIGTSSPFGGGLIVLPANTGNVGIGSLTPGQALDVTGTTRTTNLTMSGQSPIAGYVLTASDSSGDATWSSAGGVSGWTVTGNNVYETFNGNVGIGTSLLTTAALTVMNGNVGIGTWIPGGALIVQGGNIGFGTVSPQAMFVVNGNSVLGKANSSADSITSSGTGSLAGGYAADGLGTGNITASNLGSLAFGSVDSLGGTSAIVSSGNGSVALGLNAASTLTSSNAGSIAMGVASQVTGILQSTGEASVAIGQSVQANADNAFALGLNVINQNTRSFMVGFSILPTLTVTGTGVGIGTSSPFGGALIVTNGNVGIGSLTPGQLLDVQGTIRAKNLTMSGQSPIAGYVLTASDSSGDATWSSAGGVSGWTVTGNNVYETFNGNVGIGTNLLTTAALTVMNGNVGIGTWIPGGSLIVQGGNVGFGTTNPQTGFVSMGNVGIGTWTAAGGNLIINGGGNVGIGSAWPGARLDVNGTVRMTGFNIVSGAAPTYVLTSDASGNGTWQPVTGSGTVTSSPQFQIAYYPSTGTTVQGASNFQFNGANVGIGTTLSVNRLDIQGSVGIGTAYAGYIAAPPNGMIVQGNVGIGSSAPGVKLDVTGTVRITNLTMSGQSPVAGYVLTASDSSGDATWSSAGGVSGWTVTGNNVYEAGNGNVGIGTNFLTTAALTVMNGNVGIGTWVPSSTLSLAGSMAVTVVSTSGPYTATASDNVILVNAGGAVTITLPLAASVPGREYVIKKTDNSPSNAITISNGSDTIDGQASLIITLQYQSYTVISDGTHWDII